MLRELPQLQNLDGKRSPQSQHIRSQQGSCKAETSEATQRLEPSFEFEPPKRWLDAAAFSVPNNALLSRGMDSLASQGGKLEHSMEVCSATWLVKLLQRACTCAVETCLHNVLCVALSIAHTLMQ